jgi:hypothetical protein
VLPNIGNVVFAEEFFTRFLSFFEPALLLRVEPDVTPEPGVIHQFQSARFTKTLALLDVPANPDEAPGC